MLEDLCRAILTKDNKNYELLTFDAELPGEAQYQKLENNHKFDFAKHNQINREICFL